MCAKLDSAFTTEYDNPDSPISAALRACNSKTQPDDALNMDNLRNKALRQKKLSRAIDSATHSTQKQQCIINHDPLRRAHLEYTSANACGQWLHILPSKHNHKAAEPLPYKIMIQRRLRAPIFDSEFSCPFCDATVDRYGDHCLVCSGGGDRTRRHNLLRNELFFACTSAGLGCELEKPGLLCPRPFVGAVPEDGVMPPSSASTGNARRPADVYVARWRNGIPAAFDLAVTSGLRHDVASHSFNDPAYACRAYEDHKCNHLNTAAQCHADGIGFFPFIVEADGGGFGPQACNIISEIAKSKSQSSGDSDSVCATQVYQNLGFVLQRENSRAILRRAAPCTKYQEVQHAYNTSTALLCATN